MNFIEKILALLLWVIRLLILVFIALFAYAVGCLIEFDDYIQYKK